ncbi:hypothetical protein ACIBSV_01410 [Embleya sp. NPDC050154]|uniref:hypothetical protein n=1 Tax=Embleya sp. NPDC050154 TaxID=3363988 RepID=UPI00378BAA67
MSIDPPVPSDASPEGGEPWEWLLKAAPLAPQARAEWAHARAGWFTPGTVFSAVSLPAGAVHAAIGNWRTWNQFAEHLTSVIDGPMFYRPRTRGSDDDTYTGLVPYSVGRRWVVPLTTLEPAHRPLLIPAPDRYTPERTGPWWVVSVEESKRFCSTRALTRLVNAGRGRWLDE